MKGDIHMGFSIDELTRKAKDMANMAADKTKDAAELVKINMAIAGEQRELEKNYRLIGEWFVNEYDGEIPEEVREGVDAVMASRAKIAELEASKPVKEAAPVEEAAPVRKKCPICGAALPQRGVLKVPTTVGAISIPLREQSLAEAPPCGSSPL